MLLHKFILTVGLLMLCACENGSPTDASLDATDPTSSEMAARESPHERPRSAHNAMPAQNLSPLQSAPARSKVAREIDRRLATLDALIGSLDGQIGDATTSLQEDAVEHMDKLKHLRKRLREMKAQLQSADARALDRMHKRVSGIETVFMAEYEMLSVAIANDHAQSSTGP